MATFNGKTAELTDAKTGRALQSTAHDLGSPDSVWTHDGTKAVAMRSEEALKILDMTTGKMTTGDPLGPSPLQYRAIVSPDNRRLAVEWGGSNSVEPGFGLYDSGTGKEIARMKLAEWGNLIGFAPDSKTLLIGGSEFVIYDAATGKKIRALKLLDDVSFEHDWNQ